MIKNNCGKGSAAELLLAGMLNKRCWRASRGAISGTSEQVERTHQKARKDKHGPHSMQQRYTTKPAKSLEHVKLNTSVLLVEVPGSTLALLVSGQVHSQSHGVEDLRNQLKSEGIHLIPCIRQGS
jgi:hypothetical protein